MAVAHYIMETIAVIASDPLFHTDVWALSLHLHS